MHATKSKPKQKRKHSGSAPLASIPTPISPGSTDTSDDLFVPTAPKGSRFDAQVEQQVESEDDLITREAIRNLWDILSPSSKARYKHLAEPRRDADMSRRGAEARRSINGIPR